MLIYTNDLALTMPTQNMLSSVTACGGCDLLLKKEAAPYGKKACCPRCGHVLSNPKKNTVERSLALAIAGLALFIPANTLSILQLDTLGIAHGSTMLSGVVALFQNKMWILSIVVLLASIIIPLSKLLLVFYVTLGLKLNRSLPKLANCMRWYQHIEEWGMLEVYALGIIVAYVKLIDLANVIPELGLYCFVGMLLIATFISIAMDEEKLWELIEEQQRD
ncbi:MAG: paraquat-inducible protein A [Nitrosomonadaceae bacterium]